MPAEELSEKSKPKLNSQMRFNPAGNCMFKFNNRYTRIRCEIFSKLTIKTRQWRCSGIFIVNFGHISHLVLVFLLLTLAGKYRLGTLAGKFKLVIKTFVNALNIFRMNSMISD